MSRESEVVTLLRADSTLRALLPGGIYSYARLGVAGLTDKKLTPDVWTGGVFNTCALVRQRAPVPTGALQSISTKCTSTSQVIEVWVYAKTSDEIETSLARIYALMMGKRLPAAFSATWVGGLPSVMQAPELPPDIKVGRNDYRIVSIRRAAA